ncbi:MAG: hypothetical protein ACRED4_02745, partial [Brevundimonas sp.]
RMEGAGEIDHRAAMEARAAIDEEYWNRRLTGEGSMLDSLAQLSRSGNAKLAAIGKAAALAQATISGFLAIQNAWASAIFPANLPAVAITTAATAANIAGIAGMATGGHVRGPGTGTSDSIPVMLSDGEFVVRASQTKKHKKLLEALNAGMVPGYASGGLVTAGTNEGGNGREQYLGGPVDPA